MMMAMKIVDGVLVMVVMVMTYIPSCLSKKKKKKRRGKRRGSIILPSSPFMISL